MYMLLILLYQFIYLDTIFYTHKLFYSHIHNSISKTTGLEIWHSYVIRILSSRADERKQENVEGIY